MGGSPKRRSRTSFLNTHLIDAITKPALRLPRLNAIVDADAASGRAWRVPDLACAYWDAGVRFLQIRAKRASSGEMLSLVDSTLAALRARGASIRTSLTAPFEWPDTLVVVNDRADVARLAGASGVHVGQDDLTPADVRHVLPDPAIVGLSTHTPEQISSSAREPVDYIAIGPVFGTVTKDTGYTAVGLARVSDASASPHPVVAIGGITLDNCISVIHAGAAAVAVVSDLLAGGDPERRARAFVETLRRV